MTLNECQGYVWDVMEEKGFHEGRTNTRDDTLVRLCLIHTEVSEAAQEAKRHWVGEGDRNERVSVCLELADALIRILDLTACLGVDMEEMFGLQMMKNKNRPRKYGTPEEAKS
jgi:NTP pyrophosphatase (non-canonical NTP hydrolase)